ncbi:MAG: L,D-transpeptidase family protein [Sphingomicrobium sp.]
MINFPSSPTPLNSFRRLAVVAVALAAGLPVAGALAPSPAAAQAGAIAPRWFGQNAGAAAQQLIQLLSTAQADGLNPRRYNVRGLTRAVQEAQGGNPGAVQRAEAMLNSALYSYATDVRHDPNVGIIYVDRALKPVPLAQGELLRRAADAPSLSDFVSKMGWMNPIYGQLRSAIASRMYRSEAQRRVLMVNLDRARALPAGTGRYVIVNPPAARLYMYENGQVVDSMRVVAGRPDAIAQTPMMNAFIRYEALNPYWNSPPDITSRKLAPTILKEGRAYFRNRGYEVLSDWSDNARVIDPMSINWRAVAAGQLKVRMRQKPGPANSMGKMKFMFPNEQGIWLHDTPEKEKIEDAARLQSNGCVRLEDAARLSRWLFNGHPPTTQGAKPEQKVNLPSPVPLYITYLTAVPSGTSIVYFDDFYGKDRATAAPRRMSSLR